MVKPRQDEFERERDGVQLLLDMSRHVLLTVPTMRTARTVQINERRSNELTTRDDELLTQR